MDVLDLVWAIEEATVVLNGLADAESVNALAKFGVDIKADIRKYDAVIYDAYEMAEKQGVLQEVKDALKSDGADMYFFNEVDDELSYLAEAKAHEDIMYSVQEGDKVRLSNGNIRYVDSIDRNSLWVTQHRGDNMGWSADLYDVVEILEHYEE